MQSSYSAWLKSHRLHIAAALAGLVVIVGFAIAFRSYKRYERIVDRRLEDGRWRAPSRLYSQPVALRPGQALTRTRLVRILDGLDYERCRVPRRPGEYALTGADRLAVFPRGPGGAAFEAVEVAFERDRVASLQGTASRRSYATQSLEPLLLTFLLDEQRERRHVVRYEEIPEHLIKAVLAIEDRRFFHHGGLDLVGIVRAAARNLESETYAQGASTITQQLARSSFLKPEKTLKRKAQEALLSFILERRLSKREILELYLNEVYLGQVGGFNIQGVGQAARTYFGKEVRDLTLAESALLAGLIQSPNGYNPYRHPEAARTRRDQVLHAIKEAGLIHTFTVDYALSQPLRVQPPTLDGTEAPSFVELVKTQLAQRYRRHELGRRNLAIRTSLDLPLQLLAEDVLSDGLAALEKRLPPRPEAPLQGAMVVLDPRTGAVLALVGGRDHRASPFNRALRARRQPGSAFKPFVYLAAFEATFDGRGGAITPATVVDDSPSTTFSFEDERYAPRNNDDRYGGKVTVHQALAHSLNVATVKVAETVGFETVADLWSQRLGFAPIPPYPALALGAFETTPLELASAYAALASGGLKIEPRTILAAYDERRHSIDETAAPAPRRVVHEASAFLVSHLLRSVINEGTGYGVREMGFAAEAAGKTGTTNNSRDAWFAGFTPDLLCVVWVGYDDNASLSMPASEAALPIWTEFMKQALAGRKPARFDPAPEGVVFRTIDKDTGLLATAECPRVVAEAFIAGTEPRRYCPGQHADTEQASQNERRPWWSRLGAALTGAAGRIF
jgi:penicillin-binding protein 1B